MIKSITLFFLICLVFVANAQKEVNNWYFGYNAGITFNTNPPTSLTNGQMHTNEGCASISTPNGRLLFYTDGVSIWDSTHGIMPNGTGLKGATSSSQSAIIVPKPNNPDIYYVFTVADFGYPDGLQYSEVDMKLNSGKGDIVNNRKNIALKSKVCEKIVAVQQNNGQAYWVLTAKFNSDSFFAYSVTDNGVNNIPIGYRTGFKIFGYVGNSIGYLKISPNGKKVAFANCTFDTSVIGDFDASTGKISNLWKFFSHMGYGVEFSPKSQFLYTSEWANNSIFQYDLSVTTISAFIASRKIISNNFNQPGALQLGPDNKIYIAEPNTNYLSVIHAPDSLGYSCQLQKDYINLSSGICYWGLPSYIKSIFVEKLKLGNDVIICEGDSIKLTCNIKKFKAVIWNTGDTTESILVKQQGIYSAVVILSNGDIQYDTIIVKTGPKFKVFIGNDTAFCGKFSHLLKASNGFDKYNWNTGGTTMQITVNSKGIYSVKVIDSNSCPSGDTINIDEIPKPAITLDYDSVTCKYIYLSIDSMKGITYQWSTGEIGKAIKVTDKGWYSVTASHQFCSTRDSVKISTPVMPEVDLGSDTSLCGNEIILKTNEQGTYLWSTMDTRPSITVNTPGKYWVTVTRNGCSATDTIDVELCGKLLYYIPNSFTPNDDNTNEVFRVYGSNIVYVEMEIFNRWGEKIFYSEGSDPFWDGDYKNVACQESVYFYMIMLKGKKNGNVKYLKGTITLLR